MKKSGSRLLLAAMVLAAACFGLATCSYAMEINGSFQGDELVWEIKPNSGLVFSNDFSGLDRGLDWTCDPGLSNARLTTADNAASIGALNTARDLFTLTVAGACPGYYNSVSTHVKNMTTEAVVMPRPVLTWLGNTQTILDYRVYLLLADGQIVLYPYPYTDPIPDNVLAEFSWANNTGNALDPYCEFEECFRFHILADEEKPEKLAGLTPGYWKNWRSHYTETQFRALLAGTIAGDAAAADDIFRKYSAKPGLELTVLKAHLLAAQLTLNLTGMPELPNPDGACLALSGTVEWAGTSATVGEAVQKALDILNNPAAYTRGQVLDAKNLLDYINNLG